MVIITIAGSIFTIASTSWIFRKFTPVKICPICAGVAGTWLWILGGIFFGILPLADYQLPAAILMGGSVVGIAYQLEKKLHATKSPIIFKLLFIPAGFVAAYSLILSQWLLFIPEILFLAVLPVFYMKPPIKTAESKKNIEKIKKRMEDCC